MANWVSFVVGMLLWMTWGCVSAAIGIKVSGETCGKFWALWGVTLAMVLWYGNKHHFEKPTQKEYGD